MEVKKALRVALMMTLAACAGSDRAEDSEPAAGGGTPAAASPAAAGRDLSGLDVCELMPTELVSQTLGSPVARPGTAQDYGGNSKGCEYGMRPRGGATYEYVAIWVQDPTYFEEPESILETDRGLGQESDMEPLVGLGEEAYVINNETERQSSVYVLLQDDVMLQVTAENRDRAVKLAEVTLGRLGTPEGAG